MKTIKYKKIIIRNFKGTKFFEADLSDNTNVWGVNETGKTTNFVDAINFLWFGKNGEDKEKFSIKNTVDLSMNRLDHSVELHFEVDGVPTTAKRIYAENWTTTRGTGELKLENHVTKYEWNGAPLGSASEYQKKVASILDPNLFKLITNPRYFNIEMSADQRRNTLINMASDVTDEKVVNGNKAFRELMEKIGNQKSMKEYQAEIKAKISKTKKEKAEIEPGIKAIKNVTPLPENWDEIEKEKQSKLDAIKRIDSEIESVNADYESKKKLIKAHQDLVLIATRKMGEIVRDLTLKASKDAQEANKSLNEAKYQIRLVRDQIKLKSTELANLEKDITTLNNSISELTVARQKFVDSWYAEDARKFEFDESKCICPTCQRQFETSDIEAKKAELRANFIAEKDRNLESITKSGKVKADAIKAANLSIESKQEEINKVKVDILNLQSEEKSFEWCLTAVPAEPKPIEPMLEAHAQYQAYKAESEKPTELTAPDVKEQTDTKAQIQESIDALNRILQKKTTIQTNEAEISKMLERERLLSQEIASLERIEMTIDDFNKTKILAVEDAVNGRFKKVKFQLFEKQMNGGENAVCNVMVDGVPFSDLNNANKINAGLDCVNALQQFYGVSAPVVVDNAEAVNEVLPIDTQMIKLFVQPLVFECMSCGYSQHHNGHCDQCLSVDVVDITPKGLVISNN